MTARSDSERLLAQAAQRREAVLTGNGATALWSVLASLDLPPHTPILYPDLTGATAVHAAVLAGHAPVFADVRAETAMPTSADLAVAAAAGSAGAMVPTRLFGRRGRLPTPDPTCPQVVDASHGDISPATLAGGLAAVVDFGRGRQLDLGGGGAVLTDDPALADRVRQRLADLPVGRLEFLQPAPDGLPHRLGAALTAHAEQRRRRRARARLLREAVAALPGVDPIDLDDRDVPWRVTLRVAAHRDAVARALNAAGIPCTRLFTPVHRLAGLPDHRFPVATALATTLLNLDPDGLGDDPESGAQRVVAVMSSLVDPPLRHRLHAGT